MTAADGGYQLGPLVTGPHLIRIESENHLGMQPTEHRIDASTEPLDFTLTRPTRVQGILVDTGGHPLSRRMVSLRRITRATGLQGRLEASSYTDLDGGFVLLSRSRGEGVLVIDEDGLAPERLAVRLPSRDVRFVVREGATVSGTVLDVKGAPMKGVTVVARSIGMTGLAARRGFTNEDGRFTLRGVPPGLVAVEAEIWIDSRSEFATRKVEAVDQKTLRVTLRFPKGRTVSGIAVDDKGRPLAGVAVLAYGVPEEIPSWRPPEMGCGVGLPEGVRSDSQGRFVLRNLGDPRYELSVTREGYTFEPLRSRGGTLVGREWGLGADGHPLRLVMKRRPHVRGRVVDEGGIPLTRFTLNKAPVETPDGDFDVPVPDDPGPQFVVNAYGFAALERSEVTRTDEGDIDLGVVTLSRGRTVRGTLRDAATGALITGGMGDASDVTVHVGLQREGSARDAPSIDYLRGVPAPDGTFVLEHLPTSSITLSLTVVGYLPLQRTLAAEEQTFTDVLDAGAVVEVHVQDARGQPLPATVSFTHVSGDSFTRRIATKGTLSARAFEPGIYWVKAMPGDPDRDERFAPQLLRIPSSGTVALTLGPLTRGSTLTLRLPDGTRFVALFPGSVPAPRHLEALLRLGQEGHPQEQQEDEPALATFHLLAAGRYTLFAVGGMGGKFHREELNLPTQGETTRDLHAVWQPFNP